MCVHTLHIFFNQPGGSINLPIASMNILKHKAIKNTPFMSAPKTSARCQPYEYCEENVVFEASCSQIKQV